MYLYFDKTGTLKTVISHGEIPRQGNPLSLFLCFDRDSEFNEYNIYEYLFKISFTYPDGTKSDEFPVNPNSKGVYLGFVKFEKLIDSEVTFDLIPGNYYYTFYTKFTASQATQQYGKMIIHTAVYHNYELKYEQNASIFVEKTLGNMNRSNFITPDQYNFLLSQINQYIIEFNSLQPVMGVETLPEIDTADEKLIYRVKENDVYKYYNFDGTSYNELATFKYIENIENLIQILQDSINTSISNLEAYDKQNTANLSALQRRVVVNEADISSLKNEDIGLKSSINEVAGVVSQNVDNIEKIQAEIEKINGDENTEGSIKNQIKSETNQRNEAIDQLQQQIIENKQIIEDEIERVDSNITTKLNKVWDDIALANELGDNDYFIINSGSNAYKITFSQLKNLVGSSGGVNHYKGDFLSYSALLNATYDGTITPQAGDYAFVNTTDYTTETPKDYLVMYIWDVDADAWKETTSDKYVQSIVFDEFQYDLLNGLLVVHSAKNATNAEEAEYANTAGRADNATHADSADEATTARSYINSDGVESGISESFDSKQNKLTAGTGISIAEDGTISVSFANGDEEVY